MAHGQTLVVHSVSVTAARVLSYSTGICVKSYSKSVVTIKLRFYSEKFFE